MSRPKTKAPPISFRLSLSAHEALVRLATKEGLTPAQYVADWVEEELAAPDAELKAFTDAYVVNDPEEVFIPDLRPGPDDLPRGPIQPEDDERDFFGVRPGPDDLSEETVTLGPLKITPARQALIDQDRLKAAEEALDRALREIEPPLVKHPGWRVNALGLNVCTVCGALKRTDRNTACGGPRD